MAVSVIRFTHDASDPQWGILFGAHVAPVPGNYPTTGELLRFGREAIHKLSAADATLLLSEAKLLPPVTRNQQFICQGTNYASHVRESGMDPDKIGFNTIFTKATSSISAADADVIRPGHVKLLDYEIELGLVVGQEITAPVDVGPNDLPRFLAGVTIVNDISARDVQLPQAQFYKGKSYRGFAPTGPVLLLLDEAEWRRWPELRMQLFVNGQPRQDAHCGDMIFAPHQTLSELSGIQDLSAGDLIATGTPAGCAAVAPGKLVQFIARHFMSEAAKWGMFIRGGTTNPRYLQPGDTVHSVIRTDDGALDLGEQNNRVVASQ